jgi:hypothetical protein
MDWVSPASALIGTIIGAASTVLVQRGVWRQQTEQAERSARRQLYGSFLTELEASGERLWAIADGVSQTPAQTRRQSAHEAFNAGSLVGLLSQLMISSPQEVAQAADRAFKAMRRLRTVVGEGHAAGSADHQAALAEVHETGDRLQQIMRTDLTGRAASALD